MSHHSHKDEPHHAHTSHGSDLTAHEYPTVTSHSVMYFHASTFSTILFKNWTTVSWTSMLGSCIAIFIIATLYEGLKVLREYLLHYAARRERIEYDAGPNLNGNLPVSTACDSSLVQVVQNRRSNGKKMLNLWHLLQTFLHLLQVVISYFLMLIFMTYNVYLCTAVAVGAATGYFLFGWKRSFVIDINEHCH